MTALYNLEVGDYFICDVGAHKGHLYRFVSYVGVEESDNGSSYVYADTIAFTSDDECLIICKPYREKWNPHCNVTKVTLQAIPV